MKKFSLMLLMLFFGSAIALAQRTITGTMSDEKTKEPLIGASVLVKGTTIGSISDMNGLYTLEVPAGATTLVFSFVGYQNQEIILGASNVINVNLSEGAALQEVIVTALGTKRESKALGYAAQQVDGDKLKDANTTNVVDALNGKVAGVQITSSAGTAGASSRLVLRGPTSLDGNNQALFVIDGLRIDNSELSTDAQSIGSAGTAGVAQSNRAIDINPSDIESVTVLKGAAASALYGVDGARGVILITTKKGNKKGKGLSIEYNSTVTVSQINKTVPLQNKFGLGTSGTPLPFTSGSPLVWGPKLDSMFYDGVATEFDGNGTLVGKSNPAAKLDRPAKIYDPYDVFQKGLTVQHNLALTGGDAEKTSFRFAFGNLQEEGVIPKNTFNRTNLTLGTTSNLLDNKLHFRSTVQYIHSTSRRIIQGNSASGLLLGLLRTPPTFDNANGSTDPLNDPKAIYFSNGQQRTFRNGVGFDNPYWVINKTPYTDEVNRFLGNIDVLYDVVKGLSINAKVGTDIYQDNRIQKYEINSRAVPGGRIFDDRFTSRNLDAYLTALGTVSLTKDLNLSYTVGGNLYASYLDNVTVQGDGLDNSSFVNFNNTISKLVTPNTRNQKSLSLLGSVDLGYKSFLYLGVTGRNDWVSNLIVPSRAFNASEIGFFYPSANVSFVFSEIAKIKELNYGKLRFSIGQVGGGAPSPYLTSTPFTVPVINDPWTGGIPFPFKSQYGLSLTDVKGANNLKPF
ncbi:MAG: hypothetical protein RLZZ628_351 [Bacteroidota bacterium]|jgi:TonB-linked SusC/RagA family outer membrane protein